MADGVITNIFNTIDSDRSGCISQTEMDDAFKVFDKNGDGMLSRDEWTDSFVANFQGTRDQAVKAFTKLDAKSSGEISMADISRLFLDMDADGSGTVSKEEFQAFWSKLLS